MELIKILKYLNKKFPEKTMADWDKGGLQIYDHNLKIKTDQNIRKVLITLDLSKSALDQALNNHVELIITRHPFIFNDLAVEKNNPQKELMIKKLIARNILIYSIHSNYDVSSANNLPSLLQQKIEIKKVMRFGTHKEGLVFSLKQKTNFRDFYKTWRQLFPEQHFYRSKNWSDQPIKEFYFVSGAGGDVMMNSNLKNAIFVTGELKWHHWIYALDNQIQTLVLGHEMENHFVNHIESLLKNAYPDLQIIIYNHQSPFTIIAPEA